MAVEDSTTGTDGGFPAASGIPRKSQPRLHVAIVFLEDFRRQPSNDAGIVESLVNRVVVGRGEKLPKDTEMPNGRAGQLIARRRDAIERVAADYKSSTRINDLLDTR